MLFFTISIAVIYEGQPIAGVIFEPATESMFTAARGIEAQLNGRRITAGKEKMDKFSSVGLDSHFDSGVPAWAREIMQRTRFRNLGSTALQLAYVAKGSLIAAIHTCPKLWDIAAGAIIAETAEALVTDWQGEKIFPIDLDKYGAEEFKIIAANKKVHPKLLALIKS
jgi:myo-inositol-1(or 4)-monophosphatase